MVENIILVGTVHIDHKGPERLEKVLAHFKPDIIHVESTPVGATKDWRLHQYLINFVKDLEQKPWHLLYTPEQMARLKSALLSDGYESWVPKVYKNGSPDIDIYCIGRELTKELNDAQDSKHGQWVMQQLAAGKTIQELLISEGIDSTGLNIKDFVENGSEETHQKYVDETYDNTSTREFISKFGCDLFREGVLENDKLFAEKIRKRNEKSPDKRILVVLGSQHFFGEYSGSTYDLLSDLNPKRLKLKEADGF